MGDIAHVDVTWALADYLTGPTGRLHHIVGLHLLAADTLRVNADVLWVPDLDRLGRCDGHRILLSPSLLDAWPYAVRRVWSHELGHIVCGRDHERVYGWQARYGELILPPAWMY